jgi:hypothetical protein
MTVYIVMEQWVHEDPRVLGVFSSEESADEFICENEADDRRIDTWIENWIVDGDYSR